MFREGCGIVVMLGVVLRERSTGVVRRLILHGDGITLGPVGCAYLGDKAIASPGDRFDVTGLLGRVP
jgi:hypothetical protein